MGVQAIVKAKTRNSKDLGYSHIVRVRMRRWMEGAFRGCWQVLCEEWMPVRGRPDAHI
jgi:hypothetical protein